MCNKSNAWCRLSNTGCGGYEDLSKNLSNYFSKCRRAECLEKQIVAVQTMWLTDWWTLELFTLGTWAQSYIPILKWIGDDQDVVWTSHNELSPLPLHLEALSGFLKETGHGRRLPNQHSKDILQWFPMCDNSLGSVICLMSSHQSEVSLSVQRCAYTNDFLVLGVFSFPNAIKTEGKILVMEFGNENYFTLSRTTVVVTLCPSK